MNVFLLFWILLFSTALHSPDFKSAEIKAEAFRRSVDDLIKPDPLRNSRKVMQPESTVNEEDIHRYFKRTFEAKDTDKIDAVLK